MSIMLRITLTETTWIRTKINFALIQRLILCLHGSHIATTRNKEHIDIKLKNTYI